MGLLIFIPVCTYVGAGKRKIQPTYVAGGAAGSVPGRMPSRQTPCRYVHAKDGLSDSVEYKWDGMDWHEANHTFKHYIYTTRYTLHTAVN